MTSRSRGSSRPWIQTSLRGLLVFSLVTGTLLGMFGPQIARQLREWRSRPPPPPPATTVPAWLELRQQDESNGYFESAETPLR